MTAKAISISLVMLFLSAALVTPGCTASFVLNHTEELTGSIIVIFINNTPYRAAFTYGAWNPLELNPPGGISYFQLQVEPYTSTNPLTVDCDRSYSVATQRLYDRGVVIEIDEDSGFDPNLFDTVVHFSDQPSDSDLAAVATVGTAVGVEKRLGVDFECGDQLIFTFEEDPDAEGGFRIDFALIEQATGE